MAPVSDSLSIRLRLIDLTLPRTANSPAHSSKGTPSPAPGCPGSELRQLVGSRFQVLFHSPPGVLFTFPSRYWFTIGRQGVLSLRGWAPRIHTGFHVPRVTREHHTEAGRLSPTGLLPSAADLSMYLRLTAGFVTPLRDHRLEEVGPTTPAQKRRWAITLCRFRLIPVRSPLLRESLLLSLP